MKIFRKAQAGSFESSDILILAEPGIPGKGISMEIDSGVDYQFGEQIKKLILSELEKFEVKNIHLVIKDKGAVEPVIKARLETVLLRAANKQKGTMD